MGSRHEFFKRIKIRPFVYLGMLLLSLILSALEAYNPVIKNYGSLSRILEHNYINTLSGWTVQVGKFFGSEGALSKTLLALFVVLVVSAILAVFLSGYTRVLIYSVEDKQKKKGEFAEGIKKNYLKTLIFIFLMIILSAILFFGVLYSAIPTVFLLKLFLDGDTGVIFTMLIVALLTIIVMLFCVLFYGMYLSYIVPSIAGLKKRNIRAGVKMTNTYAWYLLPKTALFLFFATVLRLLLFVLDYGSRSLVFSIVVLLITTVLRSVLYYIYFYFVFNTFIAMREDLFPDYQTEMPVQVKNAAAVPQQTNEAAVSFDADRKRNEVSDTEESKETYTDEYDDSFEV